MTPELLPSPANDQHAALGLSAAHCWAPSYAEVLKALDDLHIVCECATNPEVDEWYRGDVFAKEARANAIAVLCRVRNPAKLQPEETEVEVRARVIYAKNGNVRFWEILPNGQDQTRTAAKNQNE